MDIMTGDLRRDLLNDVLSIAEVTTRRMRQDRD